MIMNIMNFLSNIDKNSQFLLIIIGIISGLLILMFIINHLSYRKSQKLIRKQKAYKKKLNEEINLEAKNIETIKASSIVKKEDPIEVLEEEFEKEEILEESPETRDYMTFNLNEYEKEEELSAVISYEELCQRFKVEQKVYNTEEVEVMNKVQEMVEPKEERKFKPTRYVSPIFGVDKE